MRLTEWKTSEANAFQPGALSLETFKAKSRERHVCMRDLSSEPSTTRAWATKERRVRMVPLFNADDTHVDVIDVAVFAATLAACGILFPHGGFLGFAGALIGAAVGRVRPLNPLAPWRSVFKAAIGGLWGGVMIGGMFAAAFTRMFAPAFTP
jgi:hypothetical protein